MDLEKEIERIKQNKSLKHVELYNEFDEREDLFVDKIDDELDDEWIHCRKKLKKTSETRMVFESRKNMFIKNVYLEIKYKKIDDIILIENLFKELKLSIIIDYVKKWKMPLYINNFISKCTEIKSSYYKVSLLYFENQHSEFLFDVEIYSFSKIHKNIKIFINYDFKENKPNKKFLNIKKSPEDKFDLFFDILTTKVCFNTGEVEYNIFGMFSTINFRGNPHFIIFTNENESLETQETIFEEITFKFFVFNLEEELKNFDNVCSSNFDINKIINNFVITNKNKMINITIPKDKIITRLFMNKIFFIIGLNDQFIGIKNIKQLLSNKQNTNINNYCDFMTVITDLNFSPLTFEKMKFYIF